jgi:hypothetical protein
MVPAAVEAFRTRYRAEEIGPGYSGVAHFAFTSITAITIIVVTLWGVHAPTWRELLAVPIAFLVANAGEYFGHRGPMHHRRRGLGLLFKRHTLQHHQFFTVEAMSYESARDVKMVLFPWYMIAFFFGGMALPIGAGVWLLFGANVARLFVATLVGYFLTYEWLHFSYHLSPDTALGRLGIIRALRRHHATHHDLQQMNRYNFNITFPICDWLFGTSAPRR